MANHRRRVGATVGRKSQPDDSRVAMLIPKQSNQSGNSQTKPLLLAVDDVQWAAFELILYKLFEVHTARDVRTAIKLLALFRFPVVLVDFLLDEGVHGDALCRYLRRFYPNTRIVLISGKFAPGELEEQAKKLGVDACMGKPWDNEKLRALLMEQAEIARALAAQPPAQVVPIERPRLSVQEIKDSLLLFGGAIRPAAIYLGVSHVTLYLRIKEDQELENFLKLVRGPSKLN